jgi:hypothetical protein
VQASFVASILLPHSRQCQQLCRLCSGDVHVHIHFDQPNAQLPQSRSTSPGCGCQVDPGSLGWPQTVDGTGQAPQSHRNIGPTNLPLQPMTRLATFDDSLADLVCEVESILSHPGCSNPYIKQSPDQEPSPHMSSRGVVSSVEPCQSMPTSTRPKLKPARTSQQQPTAATSTSRKAETRSSSDSRSSEQSVNMAQCVNLTMCFKCCGASGRSDCIGQNARIAIGYCCLLLSTRLLLC